MVTDDDPLGWAARIEDLRRVLEQGALRGVYDAVSVHPEQVLAELRASGIPVRDLDQLRQRPASDLDPHALRAIRRAQAAAAVGGASLGLGGLLSIAPALGQLGVVVLRLAQTMSLTYGFDHRTQRGQIELWKSMARGLGAGPEAEDFEGTQRDLARAVPAVVRRSTAFVNPLAVRLAQATAARLLASAPSSAARLVPVVGGGVGMMVNWRQVGAAGRRIQAHFRAAHAVASLDLTGAVEAVVVTRSG